MASDQLTDSNLRALVVSTLDSEPDATFTRVRAHLHSREGRTLESAETDRLREAYDAELANPTGAHRVGAVEAAEIVTNQTSSAVTVPLNALVTFAGIDKVILIENGKALEKAVTVGRRGDNWIEIKAGINLGQTVVIDPGNLQSGQSVTIDTQ